VIDASASNVDGFPSRDTCVCSIQLNRPILNKVRFSQDEIHDWQAIFLSKCYSVVMKQWATYSCF
jgi:hypothetical protein